MLLLYAWGPSMDVWLLLTLWQILLKIKAVCVNQITLVHRFVDPFADLQGEEGRPSYISRTNSSGMIVPSRLYFSRYWLILVFITTSPNCLGSKIRLPFLYHFWYPEAEKMISRRSALCQCPGPFSDWSMGTHHTLLKWKTVLRGKAFTGPLCSIFYLTA